MVFNVSIEKIDNDTKSRVTVSQKLYAKWLSFNCRTVKKFDNVYIFTLQNNTHIFVSNEIIKFKHFEFVDDVHKLNNIFVLETKKHYIIITDGVILEKKTSFKEDMEMYKKYNVGKFIKIKNIFL